MINLFVLLVFATLSFLSTAVGKGPIPRFKDYSVEETFSGKPPRLVLSSEARMFRTRLRNAAKQKPNFAGHYIVAEWGCGAECLRGGIIDASTGKVIMLPSVCCYYDVELDSGFVDDPKFKPIDFRLDSRLIVFRGVLNEDGGMAINYCVMEGDSLKRIRSIPRSRVVRQIPVKKSK